MFNYTIHTFVYNFFLYSVKLPNKLEFSLDCFSNFSFLHYYLPAKAELSNSIFGRDDSETFAGPGHVVVIYLAPHANSIKYCGPLPRGQICDQ